MYSYNAELLTIAAVCRFTCDCRNIESLKIGDEIKLGQAKTDFEEWS